MSTAFFPTNMRQQSSGGYSNKSSLQNIPYVPWKGTGIYSNPVTITSTHIRPLTNSDPGNIFPTGFGLPRPIKHYRKGTVIPIHFKNYINEETTPENIEPKLIAYNVNRAVKSSMSSSLGGGNGGTGLIAQMNDMPGSFIVKDNSITNSGVQDNSGETIDKNCINCNGVGLVSNWMPIQNLTEKPEPNVTNPPLCCNQQRKAIQRVLPTNTNVKKNYFQSSYMYLYNRCQTFQQRQFNFIAGPIDKKIMDLFLAYPFVTAKILEYSKPGDPLSLANYYVAQCNPNFTISLSVEIGFINHLSKLLLDSNFINITNYEELVNQPKLSVEVFINSLQNILTNEQYKLVIEYLYKIAEDPYNAINKSKGCAQVYYKPNNPQFAKQGGVSSSTRILKLNVDTITKSAYNKKQQMQNTYIFKDKVPPCNPQVYSGNPFFFQGQHQNKLMCKTKTNGSEYHTYNTVNSSSTGNYIGATQSRGAGYANKQSIGNTTYFDNISLHV
jgi:hypothetical protein